MVSLPPAPDGVPARAGAGPDRVFRWPLVVFLTAVAAVVGGGWWANQRLPGVAEGVLWLADGDLDAEERRRVLGAVVAGAQHSDDPEARWAGLMAAVALGDRAGYSAVAAPLLGPGATLKVVPKPMQRSMLHLGEPMLGNLARGLLAEVDGDRAAAGVAFRQVLAQGRFVAMPLAVELATAGLERLR